MEVGSSDYEEKGKGHANMRQSSLLRTISAQDLSRIEKVYSQRLDKLLLWQKASLDDFKTTRKKQEMELLQEHHMKSYKVCASHVIPTVRDYRKKLPNKQLSVLRKRFYKHMQSQLRGFIVQQIKDRNREKMIKEHWIEKAKVGTLEKHFMKIPLYNSGLKMKKFKSQLNDSSDDEEPHKSFNMQYLTAELEIEAITSSEPKEILTWKGSAVSKPVLANSVQVPETNGRGEHLDLSTGSDGDRPLIVESGSSQPTCPNTVSEKFGPLSFSSEAAENGTESDPKILALRQLEKLRDLSTGRHHGKMEQLSLACEIELIQLKMKYGVVIDSSYLEELQRKKELLVLRDKNYRQQILEEGLATCGLSNDP